MSLVRQRDATDSFSEFVRSAMIFSSSVLLPGDESRTIDRILRKSPQRLNIFLVMLLAFE